MDRVRDDPNADVQRIEAKLASFVRDYTRSATSGSSENHEEALRWVCAGFEYLLGALLDRSRDWSGWVDGIEPAFEHFPDAVTVVSEVEIGIRGRAYWSKASRGPFYIEPFFGAVRIAQDHDVVESYEILFSNATQGLGLTPYGKHIRRSDWYLPSKWGYRFVKP